MLNDHNYADLESRLQYSFSDRELLVNALTHSSYSHDHGEKYRNNNERLEFLGDAFFDAVIAEELYMRLYEVPEGELSRLRSQIVCERSLYRKAEELALLDHIRMGQGEERNVRRRRSVAIVADAMEALLGAIYLDGGYEAVKRTVLFLFSDIVAEALAGKLNQDHKTLIHELMQAKGVMDLDYRVVNETGPDHDKTFFIELWAENKMLGRGSGKSKKRAEQEAAADALQQMK